MSIFFFRIWLHEYTNPLRSIECNRTLKKFGKDLPLVFNDRFINDTSYFDNLKHPGDNIFTLNIATCYCSAFLKTRGYSKLTYFVNMNETLYKDIDFSDDS